VHRQIFEKPSLDLDRLESEIGCDNASALEERLSSAAAGVVTVYIDIAMPYSIIIKIQYGH
jgi:hypothetical protein